MGGMTMGVVYVVRTLVRPDHDLEWRRWQEEEHVRQLLELPGYLGVQRFAEIGRSHSYLNIWRLSHREAHGTPEYRIASLTPWFDRIRPFYDVEVDFSNETEPTEALGVAPWRNTVSGLMVDRAEPDGNIAAAQLALGEPYRQSLAAGPGVVRVMRLARLSANPAPELRSAASDVLLTYLNTPPTKEDAPPEPPSGVERRRYTAIGPYLPAPTSKPTLHSHTTPQAT
jgi:hypothetical protein